MTNLTTAPAIMCALLCALSLLRETASAQNAEASLNAGEAAQVAKCIRALSSGPAGDYALPGALRRTIQPPLIVTLYSKNAPLQRVSDKTVLADAAADVAEQYRLFMNNVGRPDLLETARMEITLPVSFGEKFQKDRAVALSGMEPGFAGLICEMPGQKAVFTPLTLFACAQGPDPLNEAFIKQVSAEAPVRVSAQPFYAADFIERSPEGEMLPLYRGNILLPPPGADRTTVAVAMAGLWLVGVQQEDGTFLTGYNPALDRALSGYDLGDHLRATIALLLLDQLLQREELAKAHEKALDYAMGGDRLKREEGTGLVYLPLTSDDVSGTSLLLTALSIKALRAEKPVATGAMRQLAEYLCVMTSPNGRLYASLKGARAGKPPYIVRGGVYADALIALTMFQRVAPGDNAGQAARRLADALSSEPKDIQIRSDTRTLGRVVEALAEYYKLSRRSAYADKALELCGILQRTQVAPVAAEYPDCAGGFPDKGIAPYTFSSASATCGLAAAYEAALLERRPLNQFYEPARAAAGFLLNMQYRPENDFYLSSSGAARGAFRRAPGDLNIYCGAVGEAIRALMGVTTIIAETAPMEE